MGGGLLQLVAYGAQDAYITGNPHITFWKVMYKRHTNFAMEAMRVNFTGAPTWGQRAVAVVKRNADLMYRTYLELTLPDTTSPAISWTLGAARRLGYLMIDRVEIEIGGQIMDRHYGEWLFLWESLSSNYDESVKLDAMLGGNQGGSTSTLTSCNGRPNVLYIPLQFWFNRNPGLALPLIALQYHEVHFNVYFRKAVDLVNGTAGSAGTIASQAALLPAPREAALYIDYIYLDTEERRRFAQQTHEYLIDQLQFNAQQSLTTPNCRLDLTLNHPVKELVWVFQDARKRDCGSTSSIADGYTSPFSYDDIAGRCRLQINGQDRFDERYGDYFWKVQPYQHHSGGAFFPSRADVITPSVFTASATGGVFSSNLITVSGVTGLIRLGMIITGTGVASGTYITAFGTGTGGAGTYLISSPQTLASVAVTFTLQDDDLPLTNPINVYSFALKPEEHQPSGTCNFSRIDTTTLVFDSKVNGGVGTYPTPAYPYLFRLYAVNYNVFRVMSGMGGLAYSN
jgi:hypothetical protein